MHVAFGRVRRKTEPTGPGNREGIQGFRVVSGSVGNADRKCKAKTNFAAYGQNLGVYAAKPNLPVLGLRKLTPMVPLLNTSILCAF